MWSLINGYKYCNIKIHQYQFPKTKKIRSNDKVTATVLHKWTLNRITGRQMALAKLNIIITGRRLTPAKQSCHPDVYDDKIIISLV